MNGSKRQLYVVLLLVEGAVLFGPGAHGLLLKSMSCTLSLLSILVDCLLVREAGRRVTEVRKDGTK